MRKSLILFAVLLATLVFAAWAENEGKNDKQENIVVNE